MVGSATSGLYEQYVTSLQRIADIRYSSAVLQWDQETYLPPKGAAFRAQQIATLSETAHNYFTDEKLGSLLQELLSRNDLSTKEKRNVELSWEDYTRQKKFNADFVRQLSEAVNKSFHSWLQARKVNDFRIFEKDLATVVEFKKKEAELLGYQHHSYDALLNEHDKGANTILLDKIFDQIRDPLKKMLDQILSRPQVDDSFLHKYYSKNKQWKFGLMLLKDLGYDLEAGRQDISEHPFTVSFNSHDVRITTRIAENDLGNMIWSCIHELGHAFYEQGLPEEQYGLPLGEAASFSIHESQSRLWENHIGRSQAFCERYLPLLQQSFPQQLKNVSSEDFYKAINKAEPSLIRTETDEITYHFHIMIRYEIEKLLIDGSICTSEIPAYWNEHYRKYLNISVPDDKRGCLQDIHWSHGSFGYFSTYSMGSLYAAQFFATANKQLAQIEESIRKGETQTILNWLKKEVYEYGRMYTSEDLCLKISEQYLNTQLFLDYAFAKYSNIYQF